MASWSHTTTDGAGFMRVAGFRFSFSRVLLLGCFSYIMPYILCRVHLSLPIICLAPIICLFLFSKTLSILSVATEGWTKQRHEQNTLQGWHHRVNLPTWLLRIRDQKRRNILGGTGHRKLHWCWCWGPYGWSHENQWLWTPENDYVDPIVSEGHQKCWSLQTSGSQWEDSVTGRMER